MTNARALVCSCGARYRDFRTGMTFRDVRHLLWSWEGDPSAWRSKRRRAVLGAWHELKLQFWYATHGGCD